MEKPNKKDGFLRNRWRSMGFALNGFYYLIKNENAIKVHLGFAVLFTILGFVFQLRWNAWLFQILALGLILSIEGLNTAIEELCDFVHPDYHDFIGKIKDISAGAVTFAAMAGYTSILLIYIKEIIV